MLSFAGGPSPALHADGRKSSHDRPSCLENPRPAGAESTLTENAASPFHAEPRHDDLTARDGPPRSPPLRCLLVFTMDDGPYDLPLNCGNGSNALRSAPMG
jgi:hypothetical protein